MGVYWQLQGTAVSMSEAQCALLPHCTTNNVPNLKKPGQISLYLLSAQSLFNQRNNKVPIHQLFLIHYQTTSGVTTGRLIAVSR